MLHSKKHTKTPPEKLLKKYTKLSPFTVNDSQKDSLKDPLKDPLKDTDDESEAGDERTSNVHRPNVVVSTARIM